MNLDENGDIAEARYDFDHPERALWCAALVLLLEDARRHYVCRKPEHGKTDGPLEFAFNDVVAVGPQLRNLCRWNDMDADYVSRKFIESLG